MQEIISIGNIERHNFPSSTDQELPLYLGSGRCGAQFDAWGLMNRSDTALRHADAWARDAVGKERWMGAFSLRWDENAPETPRDYRQKLTLANGTLETRLVWADSQITLRASFHPDRRDWLALEIEHDGPMPALRLAPAHSFEAQDSGSDLWTARTLDCLLALQITSQEGAARLESDENGVAIHFEGESGRHFLRVGLARWNRRGELLQELAALDSPEKYVLESAQSWEKRWGNVWISFPDAHLTAFWARSLFYVLASYGPDVRSPAAPMGWADCGWGFGYPHDLAFIHPALLRLGHFDIARAWVENFRVELPKMQDYARRIWNAPGAMAPWHLPISRDAPLALPGGDWRQLPPGDNFLLQYQIHNAAYPARMAHQTAQFLGDETWTREVAWPLVVEAARFFASFLTREADGKWSLYAEPSSGQDEFGGHNAKNYLDAVFGARYCLESALQMAEKLEIELPEKTAWLGILGDGFAFDRLRDPESGILATCENPKWRLGCQKHPVQLDALAFLPLEGGPDSDSCLALEKRHELCIGDAEGTFYGWTLPAFWLAASHAGDASALENDLDLSVPSLNVDENWVQIYESSPRRGPFFVTSHGLALQALSDAFVHDFWGETQIGSALPPSWSGARFSGLRTQDGLAHDGHFDGQTCHFTSQSFR